MRRYSRIVLAVLTLLAMAATLVCVHGAAGEGAGQAGAGGADAARRLVQKLELSQDQIARLKAILGGGKEEAGRLAKETRVARLKLQLGLEEEIKQEKLAAAVDAYRAARKQQLSYRQSLLDAAFGVLNPVQQAKVLLADRDDWWQAFVSAPAQVSR